MSKILAIILFSTGAIISCLNFYLSFLRPVVHRLRRGTFDGYRFESGVPLLGSLLLVIAAVLMRDSAIWLTTALVVAFLDTGGFLGSSPASCGTT